MSFRLSSKRLAEPEQLEQKNRGQIRLRPRTFWLVPRELTYSQEAGISIQAAGNVVFSAVAVLLWYRTKQNSLRHGVPTPFPKTKSFRMFVAAIIISNAAIILRSVYRVVELAQGWRGYLITTEPWFYGFDTFPMALCMGIWIIGHPGITLGKELGRSNLLEKNSNRDSEDRFGRI
jgi:RTA1 like protein